ILFLLSPSFYSLSPCFSLSLFLSELCEGAGVRGFLLCVTFLGKLVDAIPDVALMLTTVHLCVLEAVCLRLLNPDEELKAAVCYVLRGVWASEAAVQSVSHTLRDRVCVLLLQTLTHASSLQLTINSLGLLLLVLRNAENVCLLMNQTHSEKEEHEEEESHCTQLKLQHCSLPLTLKKLLLSGDESLQVASVQCVSSVLVHSPSQYCAPFIQADIPEFLFECVSSSSEVVLWCVYDCLHLLCQEPLFFSHCHSVYGETLLSSVALTSVLKHMNMQPKGVRLFPTSPGFVGVAEVVVGGVASSCFQVATQATRAAAALLSTDCVCVSRLAEECVTEVNVRENVFKAPDKQNEDMMQSFCVHLLQCCDTVYIPTVTVGNRYRTQHTVLHKYKQHSSLYSAHVLCAVCVSDLKGNDLNLNVTVFLLGKKSFCLDGSLCHYRHESLNAACCGFLLKLCTCLLSQPDPVTSVEEVEYVLRECLPSLCCRVCEWPLMLSEARTVSQNTQYCLLHLLYLSLVHGDRLLPDATVFSSVVHFMFVMQEQCDSLPPSVLQSALYLLTATQDSSPDLDWVTHTVTTTAVYLIQPQCWTHYISKCCDKGCLYTLSFSLSLSLSLSLSPCPSPLSPSPLQLVCRVRLVQVMLDVDFSSPVVCVSECGGLQRPLLPVDGSLYPLGYSGTVCLLSALQNLLLQVHTHTHTHTHTHNQYICFCSLQCLVFFFALLLKAISILHVVCQPWNLFLLYSLLNSGESLLLHPATLSLLTLVRTHTHPLTLLSKATIMTEGPIVAIWRWGSLNRTCQDNFILPILCQDSSMSDHLQMWFEQNDHSSVTLHPGVFTFGFSYGQMKLNVIQSPKTR
uniref:Uncharacterized protein n=1 Tax=Electrophorus electricus TaxID=8005 RepID=A0A4W4G5N3_ELEEL